MLQVIQTPEQQMYMSKILGYDYTIKYKVGSTNVVANALSRIPAPEEMHLFSLSVSNSVILGKFRQALVQDPQYDALLRQIHQQPETHPDLSMHKDVIFRQGNIWLPFTTRFTYVLLEEFHSSPLGGHMGLAKMLHRLHQNFN